MTRAYTTSEDDPYYTSLAEQIREDLRRQDEWERSLANDPIGIEGSTFHEYFVSDGGIASVKLRVPSNPDVCAFLSLDVEDLDKIAWSKIAGRIKTSSDGCKYIQPYFGPGQPVGRLVLGISQYERGIQIRYLNGDRLDNRRCNLEVFEQGMARYSPTSYGPGWDHVRSLVKLRSRGVCELCRKAPSEQVHHCIPVRFYREPSEAHFIENLLDVCLSCHRHEHDEIKNRMPLFKQLKFPQIKTNFLR